jgi:hypothetical protein
MGDAKRRKAQDPGFGRRNDEWESKKSEDKKPSIPIFDPWKENGGKVLRYKIREKDKAFEQKTKEKPLNRFKKLQSNFWASSVGKAKIMPDDDDDSVLGEDGYELFLANWGWQEEDYESIESFFESKHDSRSDYMESCKAFNPSRYEEEIRIYQYWHMYTQNILNEYGIEQIKAESIVTSDCFAQIKRDLSGLGSHFREFLGYAGLQGVPAIDVAKKLFWEVDLILKPLGEGHYITKSRGIRKLMDAKQG